MPDPKVITAISVIHLAAYMAPACPKLWTTFDHQPVDQRGKAIVFGASGSSISNVHIAAVADPTIARQYSVRPIEAIASYANNTSSTPKKT